MALTYNIIEVFTSEEIRWENRPLHEAIVQYISRQKIAARCFVSRGIAGCYENGEVASSKILVMSYNMPLKIEIVLPAPELERVLPEIEHMVTDGIVMVEEMTIRCHRTNRRPIPRHLLVRDVMTASPKAVTPSTPVIDIVRLLLSSTFHGAPVIDEERRVVGIITQRDLITRAGLSVRLGLLARLDKDGADTHLKEIPPKTATEVMSTPATCVKDDQTLVAAVDTMLAKELKRLPVVDARDRLVGMVSRVDVFRTVTREAPDYTGFEKHDVAVNNVRFVRDITQRDAHTVGPETPLLDILRIIDSDEVQRVVVVNEDGKFLGMIFDHDLLALFSAHPHGLRDYLIRRLPFSEVGRRYRELAERMRAETAAEVMQRDIVTVLEETPIEEVVRFMVDKGYKRIPVVDARGVFLGVVSRDSVLRGGLLA